MGLSIVGPESSLLKSGFSFLMHKKSLIVFKDSRPLGLLGKPQTVAEGITRPYSPVKEMETMVNKDSR